MAIRRTKKREAEPVSREQLEADKVFEELGLALGRIGRKNGRAVAAFQHGFTRAFFAREEAADDRTARAPRAAAKARPTRRRGR